MTAALIGHTGFVGGNLLRQGRFDATYNSSNIADIHGRRFDRLVCCGARAEKWKANADPAADRRHIDELIGHLSRVRADEVVLISTVDVYPVPIDVDEETEIDPTTASAYGRHRFALEEYVAGRFPNSLVVRLPGLFGDGLKKNVIFDLLHGNQVDKINPDGCFQYYNLARLTADLDTCRRHGLSLVNFATEPVGTRELARIAFGIELPVRTGSPARYDFRSQHADLFGGSDGYLSRRGQVLAELAAFVARQSGRVAA